MMTQIALNPPLSAQAIPLTLLYDLVIQKATGKLTIQNPFDELVTWQVYLGNGKINFASSVTGCEVRLRYLIGNYLHQSQIILPSLIDNDYDYLCKLWKENVFSLQQTQSILIQCTQEALVQILSLPATSCDFKKNDNLHHLLLNLDLEKSLISLKNKIRCWEKLHSEVNSPFQRPLVNNWDDFNRTLMANQGYGEQWIKGFYKCIENLDCLYSIASETQLSTLQVALMLHPWIKTGDITLLPYQEIQTDDRLLVTCVHEHPALQRILQYTLETGGYRTSYVDDPLKALSILFRHKPKLILIDAEMRNISGYQLCSLCRKSREFKDVPIFILGENNGISERIRAKLSGASGYISKPFLPNELIALIDQSLHFAIAV